MVAVIAGSKDVDGLEWSLDPEDTARNYQHLVNCDPYHDMLFAEVDGEVVAYSRVWWEEELDGKRLYSQFVHMLPEHRETGLRRVMLRYNERRLREIAAEHPADAPRLFQAGAADTETHWDALLVGEGYEPVRYGLEMVRPDLENIPELPLPAGLEVRPVPPEHYRSVWDAVAEAMRDHWGAQEWRDEWFESWMEDPDFQPELWQVAWDGDEVAGTVLNLINHRENEEYERLRGYTETISVRRPYRGQGLAKALIARSFKVLKAQGMTEAALGVDAENLSGALHLYKKMGFCEAKRYTTYRKPL
jgi:ribosomal protein S18 acetylase RimI-like enzyme